MKKLLLLLVLFVSVLANVMAQEYYCYKMTKSIDGNGIVRVYDDQFRYFGFSSNGNTVYTCDSRGSANQMSTYYRYQYTKDNCRYYRFNLQVPGQPQRFYDILIVSADKKTINSLSYELEKSEPYSTVVFKRRDTQTATPVVPGLIE